MSDRAAPVDGRLRRIRDRHFACYLDLATAAEEGEGGGDDAGWFRVRTGWFEVLSSEIANIRSALEWGLANERPETAAFGASLRWFWQSSRRFAEGRQVLDRALRHPDLPATMRIDALYAAGELAWDGRDSVGARARYEAARRLAATEGDRPRQARAAIGLGWACFHGSLAASAIEAFSEAGDLSEHLSTADRAYALRGLGWAKNLKGDKEAAIKAHRDARRLLEEADDPDLTTHYLVETEFLVQIGHPDEALLLADKAIALARAGTGRLIYALIAREKAADALGDAELLRRALEEGIQYTQAEGEFTWEAHFQGRLADQAMLQGDIETARGALDRGLRVLDAVPDLNLSDAGVRAGNLVRRATLAEDDGDLDLAEELHRQAIMTYRGSKPHAHARALAGLARMLAEHGDPRGARLAVLQGIAAVDDVTGASATDLRTTLAIFDGQLEEALRLLTDALDLERRRGHQGAPVAHRRRAVLLAELGRYEESRAALNEAVAASGAKSDAGDRARSQLDRARVRIALGDADGARSDLVQAPGVAQIGWAADQLHLATTLARLALAEGRRGASVAVWSAVQDYRTANRRIAPRLSRRFEEPFGELGLSAEPPAMDSRVALDALRAAVSEEFDSLPHGRDD